MQPEETIRGTKSSNQKLLTTLAVLLVVLCTVGITVLFALRSGQSQQSAEIPTATQRQPIATDTPLPKPTHTPTSPAPLTDTPTTVSVENTASPTATKKAEKSPTATDIVTPTDTATTSATDTPVVIVVTATFTPPSNVVACGPPSGWIVYIVKPGDTLYNISVRTSTTVNQLKLANCLSSNLIYLGQRLSVPFYPVSTNTPIPPTLTPAGASITTPTPVPTLPIVLPTNTPIPPTTILPVATPTNPPTNTPIPPTQTPTPTVAIPPTAISPLPTPTP